MIGPGFFMCGCPIEPEVPWATTFTCADGHNICPIHGMHEYGWRSIPNTLVKVAKHPDNPDAKREFISRPDYSRAAEHHGFSPAHDKPRALAIDEMTPQELQEALRDRGMTVLYG